MYSFVLVIVKETVTVMVEALLTLIVTLNLELIAIVKDIALNQLVVIDSFIALELVTLDVIVEVSF